MENLPAILTALGAFAAGIGSIYAAVHANRRAKEEGAEKCHEELLAAREESESFSEALHALRMKVYEDGAEF